MARLPNIAEVGWGSILNEFLLVGHNADGTTIGGGGGGVAAKRSTTQSIAGSTFVAVDLTSEEYDTDAYHDNSTNPSRLTVPSGKDGYYVVTASAIFASNSTGSRIMEIVKTLSGGGDTTLSYMSTICTDASMSNGRVTGSATVSLAAGDYVRAFVWHNISGGGALNIEGARMSMHRIEAA